MKKQNSKYQYFAIYKPYGTLSQFTAEQNGDLTLANLYNFPPDVYPVGRLDKDSEGLLLLTNNPSINHKLLNPRAHHAKTYWVQVEGIPTELALAQIKKGGIKIQNYLTMPAKIDFLDASIAMHIASRNPPIRHRQNIPTTWLSITMHEGKNRQVRRMMAAIGYPTLRLIRYSIEKVSIEGMRLGEVKALEELYFFKQLRL